MVLMNAESVIQFANPAAEEIFGWTPNDVVGQNFEMLLAQRARDQYREWSQRFWRSDTSKARQQPTETTGLKKDGAEIFIEIGFNNIELQGTRLLVAFIRDITERKRAEEESRLLQSISLVVNEAQDLDSALSIVLRTVCEATGWVLGQAWLPSSDGSQLQCSPAWFSSIEGAAQFRSLSEDQHFKVGEGLPGRVWASKQP